MKPNAMIPSQTWPASAEAVTVRVAGPADTAALRGAGAGMSFERMALP